MATAEESKRFMLAYYLMLYSVLYYDYLCTLPKEYRRIWKSEWSWVKVIYFVNRYLMLVESVLVLIGFTFHFTSDRCKLYTPWLSILPPVIAGAGGFLLLLRTHAIWGRARWVKVLLCPLLVGQFAGNIALSITQVQPLPFPGGIGPCMTFAPAPLMDLYCILPIVYDFTTSGLCIYRGWQLRRELGQFSSPLLTIFVRHGTYYAVGTLMANTVNFTFMVVSTKHLGLPTVPSNGGLLCTVFTSIFISRLALSLKSDINRNAYLKPAALPLHLRDSAKSKTKPGHMRTDSALTASTLVDSGYSFDKSQSIDEPRSATPMLRIQGGSAHYVDEAV